MCCIFIAVGVHLLFLVLDVTSNAANTNQFDKIRQTEGCILPPYPQNGYWAVLNGEGYPGEKIPSSSVIKFKCNDNYRLTDNPHMYCSYGFWSNTKIPTCERLCSPRFSTSKTIIKCFNKNQTEIDCREATDGSYMTYQCSSFFEPVPGQRKIIYCRDGDWKPKEEPACRPICGRKNDVKELIANGATVDKLIYPWIVALYRKENSKFRNVCGGTIIHTKVALTAAHCVTNEYGDPHSVQNYIIAAAKLYYKYDDPRDEYVQYFKLSHVIVHPEYKGETKRFFGDIALLVTDKPIKLGRLVKPVCITDLHSLDLYPGIIGEVAGWGITETELPPDELKAIHIPYKADSLCDRELPQDWAVKYDIVDKLCAGSPEKKVSVCKGDSGNGLIFKNIDDNRYYVHGIVSLAPSNHNSSCNIYNSALYTKVSYYYQFIDRELLRLTDCRLPGYPRHGKWILEKSPKTRPGHNVSPYDILKFVCHKGYELAFSNLVQYKSIVNAEFFNKTLQLGILDCENYDLLRPACRQIHNFSSTVTTTNNGTPTVITSTENINFVQKPVQGNFDIGSPVNGELEQPLNLTWISHWWNKKKKIIASLYQNYTSTTAQPET